MNQKRNQTRTPQAFKGLQTIADTRYQWLQAWRTADYRFTIWWVQCESGGRETPLWWQSKVDPRRYSIEGDSSVAVSSIFRRFGELRAWSEATTRLPSWSLWHFPYCQQLAARRRVRVQADPPMLLVVASRFCLRFCTNLKWLYVFDLSLKVLLLSRFLDARVKAQPSWEHFYFVVYFPP